MALDLFFVTRSPAFEKLSAAGFKPTSAQKKKRRDVVASLLRDFPGTTLKGDVLAGNVENFPIGQLDLRPGEIYLALHHVEDDAPVRAIVGWFLDHGLICEDVQGAGYGNREGGEEGQGLSDDLRELSGAQLLGLHFKRRWGAYLTLDWTLADGREAQVRFFDFVSCSVPDLGALVKAKAIAVEFTQDHVDTLHIRFEGEHVLRLEGAILHGTTVSPPSRA